MIRIAQFVCLVLMLIPTIGVGAQSIHIDNIPAHPRLFLSNEDIRRVDGHLRTSPDLADAQMARYILSEADDIVSDRKTKIVYEFDKSGKRLLEQSRLAQRRILFCSFAYRLTGSRKYLNRALSDLRDVVSFKDWNAENHFLDAAEMSLAVAIGYDWLYDKLDVPLREAIEQALFSNAYQPSCDEVFAWFYDATSNWNQVCNSGLVIAALATYERTDTTSNRIIESAVRTNRHAVKSIYGSDGIYPEGPGYWNYGTSFEVLMLSALNDICGGTFGITDGTGFDKTAHYKRSTVRPSGLQYNYSDNVDSVKPSYPLWYFAKKSEDLSLVQDELSLLSSGEYSKSDEFRLLPLFVKYAIGISPSALKASSESGSFFFGRGDTPLVIVKDDKAGTYFAAKGGRGVNPHSHLDGGSFVYEYDSIPWAVDLNRQDYETLEGIASGLNGDLWDMSQKSLRWDLLRLNNKGHNTITINGKKHNVKGVATLVSPIESDSFKGATFDLTSLFEGEAARVLREMVFLSDGSLRITDTIAASDSVDASLKWNLVTPASVKVTGSSILLEQSGCRLRLTADSTSPLEYKIFSSDPSDYDSRVSEVEEKNPGISFCGFEAVVPKGKTAVFTTVLKPE